MKADFDLLGDGTLKPSNGHGGARAGAGSPKGLSSKRMRQIEEAEAMGLDPSAFEDKAADGKEGVNTTALKKARALARKEEALAGLNELELKIKTGQYLERAAFREASATALAELAQTLRSLPDMLERKHALSPEVVLDVEQTVDDALSSVAATLEMFTGAGE